MAGKVNTSARYGKHQRGMDNRFTNRLINETSPYLLQHAHNPVNWFAWGEEALSKAKTENKVILVSIGYSACHWCHVMERESFENESVALIMNRHFVNIKVDREERPDIDHIYMDAVQAMTGSGGWPLNIFLTPDTRPFFGGTYFPPVAAFNRSSWTEVLNGISSAWNSRGDEIKSQAENLTEHLRQSNNFAGAKNIYVTVENEQLVKQCKLMFSAIMQSADTTLGGFGRAPKFPQIFTIQYLLQYHYFTGDTDALKQALLSIDKMLMGGIYDHLGGGLARYSTDAEWLAPHFEKMLYDNALLVNVLCDAFQLTTDKKYEEAIRKTMMFVLNELLSPEGGFYAALDADSEGEEGKYYVWHKEEIDQLLGSDSELFCSFFDVSENGNWEEKNILRVLQPADGFVAAQKLDKDEFNRTIAGCMDKLLAHRNSRIKPQLDDKIILGWNALMFKAVAKAAITLQDKTYLNIAETNFNFLTASFKKEGGAGALLHTFKNGMGRYPGFLDDYAFVISGLIQLYNASFNEYYLHTSYDYCTSVVDNFSDEDAVFFYFTNKHQQDVIVRKKEIYDGALPSGNAVMAENLYILSVIFDRPDWRSRADKMVEAMSASTVKYPASFGIWASLLLRRAAGIIEVAVTGAEFVDVSKKIMLKFIPNLVLMAAAAGNSEFPLLTHKPVQAESQVYLCKNYACLEPFSDVKLFIEEIDKTNKITR